MDPIARAHAQIYPGRVAGRGPRSVSVEDLRPRQISPFPAGETSRASQGLSGVFNQPYMGSVQVPSFEQIWESTRQRAMRFGFHHPSFDGWTAPEVLDNVGALLAQIRAAGIDQPGQIVRQRQPGVRLAQAAGPPFPPGPAAAGEDYTDDAGGTHVFVSKATVTDIEIIIGAIGFFGLGLAIGVLIIGIAAVAGTLGISVPIAVVMAIAGFVIAASAGTAIYYLETKENCNGVYIDTAAGDTLPSGISDAADHY